MEDGGVDIGVGIVVFTVVRLAVRTNEIVLRSGMNYVNLQNRIRMSRSIMVSNLCTLCRSVSISELSLFFLVGT